MTPAAHIFRQYDIRGIVGEDLDADVARAVGRAFGTRVRHLLPDRTPSVVVGRDNRPSSPSLAQALLQGLNEAGVDGVDIGTVPTGVLYWAERDLSVDGGIQITGSHNPPEWNGIKMSLQGNPVFGETIQGLRQLIREDELSEGEGATRTVEVLDHYVEDVLGRFDLTRPLTVAVDCGNGTASVVAERLLQGLGVKVIPLFCESDGTFPNHHPD
ncbi:MAG: phosphomannomutase/phosphoglucomutase, partial [Gemmatimonadota bacterium]